MVDFTLFRLRDDQAELRHLVDLERDGLRSVGPINLPDFTAWLYVLEAPRRRPPWVQFIESHVPGAIGWRASQSVSALLLVRTGSEVDPAYFGLAFGQAGRHILRNEAYVRRFGLITALNLIVDPEAAPRLRAFDTTRHGPNILRSRIQATAASGLEVFELDLLRDLIQRATGEPADVEQWGRRVGGSDALRLAADIPFDQIGEFCGAVDDVAASDAYRERFGWIDNIRPVTNADLIDKLEAQVLELLRARRTDLVQLAPPEVVDWDRLVRFQYHFDTGSRPLLSRQDISSDSYLGGLKAEDLNSVTARQLRGRKIVGLDANDDRIEEWPVWRCLVAEFTMADRTYILEDGAFYEVASSYLDQLNEDIGVFDRQQPILPPSRTTLTEPDYNQLAADSSSDLVLMDTQMVPFEGAPNGVELCDILTADKQLIHVKRYGGSSTLSHLYLQARTASELLITSTDFRRDAQVEINGAANDGRFNFFEEDRIEPRQFEIVLGIIKQWRAKGIESLPFFAKINLRHTLVDLSSLGYAVSVLRIPFEPAGEDAPGGEERQP